MARTRMADRVMNVGDIVRSKRSDRLWRVVEVDDELLWVVPASPRPVPIHREMVVGGGETRTDEVSS
jgi:hypothetical protein